MSDLQKKTPEQPLKSDSGDEGQPSGEENKQHSPEEPKSSEQTDLTSRTLGELFGDNLPPELKNFSNKTILDLAKSKKEAERFITKLTQGFEPNDVDLQQTQQWIPTPQQQSPYSQQQTQQQFQQQTQEVEEDEIDPVLNPEKFKQRLIEEAEKKVEETDDKLAWNRTIQINTKKAYELYILSYVNGKYLDEAKQKIIEINKTNENIKLAKDEKKRLAESERLDREEVKEFATKGGFMDAQEIDAGEYHYAFIFTK